MKLLVVSRPVTLVAVLTLLATSIALRAQTVLYRAVPNASKVSIEGTSTVHDWAVNGTLIGGSMKLPADFPLDASKPLPESLASVPEVQASIPVRSLHNNKDSTMMDNIMYEKLLMEKNPQIKYRLTEIKPVKAADGKIQFDTKGDLVVAGFTNNIAMPVTFEKLPENQLKVSGAVTVKMTDFKIEPPAPAVALGLIKTGDEVKLRIEWVTVEKPAN